MYVRASCTHLVLGKELFRIGLFVVEKIGVQIRKTRLKYGKQRSRSTQIGRKGLATLWIHARNRRDLSSHVFVGNTSLRRWPRIGSWHVQPSMQTTRSWTVWQGHQPSCSCRRWLDKPCAACTRRSSLASICNMARSEFDRSSWSSTSMMTDRSPYIVFQLRKSKTTTKRGLGITEAFVSETILSTCGNSACDRGAFAPSLAVRNSSRSSQSRAEHRSISLWTSATCLVPVPGATQWCFWAMFPLHQSRRWCCKLRKKEWFRQWWRWDAVRPTNTSIVSIGRLACGRGRGQGS